MDNSNRSCCLYGWMLLHDASCSIQASCHCPRRWTRDDLSLQPRSYWCDDYDYWLLLIPWVFARNISLQTLRIQCHPRNRFPWIAEVLQRLHHFFVNCSNNWMNWSLSVSEVSLSINIPFCIILEIISQFSNGSNSPTIKDSMYPTCLPAQTKLHSYTGTNANS